MEKKSALLFTGGSGPEKVFITDAIQKADFIAAADSGLDLSLGYGVEPDIVIGDMDSVTRIDYLRNIPDQKKSIFNRYKDQTDTEIALFQIYELGYRDITVIGGGGGRMDHFIGILYLFFRETRPSRWFFDKHIIVCIDRAVKIITVPGRRISFFPVSLEECTMKSTGLEWELDHLVWNIGDTGISNVVIKNTCTVTPVKGKILMVAELGEELVIE